MISCTDTAWLAGIFWPPGRGAGGVPQAEISPPPRRACSNLWRKPCAISASTGGRKRAGISSVPISNNNSLPMGFPRW